MADSFQDKTEQPSGKRITDACKEGNVAKSRDISSTASLLACLLSWAIYIWLGIVDLVKQALCTSIARMSDIQLSPDTIPGLYLSSLYFSLKLHGPILFTLMVVGVVSHIPQSGWLYAEKALEPKLSRLNPLNGIKRNFTSWDFIELAKGIVKLLVVGWVGYLTVKAEIPKMIP